LRRPRALARRWSRCCLIPMTNPTMDELARELRAFGDISPD